jgi:predicted NBD/HSP70 family sugar kinase
MIETAKKMIGNGQQTSLAAVKNGLSMDDIVRAVKENDEFTSTLVTEIAGVHGWVINELNVLFNPQKIIVAGPVTELGDLFIGSVREAAGKYSSDDPGVEIAYSMLGKFNGALGAAALALHQWKPVR